MTRDGRTDRMTEAFSHATWDFLSPYKLPKIQPGTTSLLFGPVWLPVG